MWIKIHVLCNIHRSYNKNLLSHTVIAKKEQQPSWCKDEENGAVCYTLRPEAKCVVHIFAPLSSNMKTWRERRGFPRWGMHHRTYTMALLAFTAMSTKSFYLPYGAATATCHLEPSGVSYSQVVKAVWYITWYIGVYGLVHSQGMLLGLNGTYLLSNQSGFRNHLLVWEVGLHVIHLIQD